MGRVRGAVLAAVATAALAAGTAGAQAPPGAWPRCIAERDGQQLALGGSVCECRHERGGTMIGKPPGWRWSCDIMRMDETQLGVPADGGRRGLPPGFTYAPQGGGGSGDDAGPWSGQSSSGYPADGGPRGPKSSLGRPPWR